MRPELPEMYALRWDLADLAMDVDRFRRPHTGTEDDAEVFANRSAVVRGICP